MSTRSLYPFAATLLAAALCSGCPDDKKPTGSSTGASAAPAVGSSAPKAGGSLFGKGVIKGSVKFEGEAVEMEVPKKRKELEHCKSKDIVLNAVIVNGEKLQDVYVGIAPGQLKGKYKPEKPAEIDQVDCVYTPRIQGILAGQAVTIKNSDPTMHNVNAGLGKKTLFNTGQPKGAAPIKKEEFEEPGIYRVKCDIHTWMRAFVIASDNPFHAVTDKDGGFKIEKVPDGEYKLVAWHSQYGKKEQKVKVKGGEVSVVFTYDGIEEEPPENKGELNDVF